MLIGGKERQKAIAKGKVVYLLFGTYCEKANCQVVATDNILLA